MYLQPGEEFGDDPLFSRLEECAHDLGNAIFSDGFSLLPVNDVIFIFILVSFRRSSSLSGRGRRPLGLFVKAEGYSQSRK